MSESRIMTQAWKGFRFLRILSCTGSPRIPLARNVPDSHPYSILLKEFKFNSGGSTARFVLRIRLCSFCPPQDSGPRRDDLWTNEVKDQNVQHPELENEPGNVAISRAHPRCHPRECLSSGFLRCYSRWDPGCQSARSSSLTVSATSISMT